MGMALQKLHRDTEALNMYDRAIDVAKASGTDMKSFIAKVTEARANLSEETEEEEEEAEEVAEEEEEVSILVLSC